MPHYFFNIHDGRNVFDLTGTEMETRREMRIHMMAVATAHVEDQRALEGNWDMEVLDEKGSIVASMDFSVETKKP